MLDIKAKALGIPVASLFGGIIRKRVELCWSHCGSTRIAHADLLARSGAHARRRRSVRPRVAERGFKALKSKVMLAHDGALKQYMPGFGWTEGAPELNVSPPLVRDLVD